MLRLLGARSAAAPRRRCLRVCADATATAAAAGDTGDQQQSSPFPRSKPSSLPGLPGLLGGLAAVAAVAAGGFWASTLPAAAPAVAAVKHFFASSVLAKSGFFAAFSLIFMSELGDKTFFIAALLAMRCGKRVSFIGSTAALAAMTIISVGIGYAVKRVPTVVESSEALGQWAGAALLIYFGLRTLKDAWDKTEEAADDELADAEAEVESAEQGGKIHGGRASPQALLEVASLIFVAEWGDRSMLATIALGAAQSPVGVAGGAIAAHALATLMAVIGGAMLSRHISEKMVGYIAGCLFLVFAAATAFGLF
ncbi:hypothetical protein ABPG75_000179 [Micractinium tetrahymenae]